MSWRFVLAACCGLMPAAVRADDTKPADQPTKFAIPYKLTDTKHVLVRAKINGKGPFNMILDTGGAGGLHHQAARQESRRQDRREGLGYVYDLRDRGRPQGQRGQDPRRRPRADRRHEQHGPGGRRTARRHRLQRAGPLPHRVRLHRRQAQLRAARRLHSPRPGKDRGQGRATTFRRWGP